MSDFLHHRNSSDWGCSASLGGISPCKNVKHDHSMRQLATQRIQLEGLSIVQRPGKMGIDVHPTPRHWRGVNGSRRKAIATGRASPTASKTFGADVRSHWPAFVSRSFFRFALSKARNSFIANGMWLTSSSSIPCIIGPHSFWIHWNHWIYWYVDSPVRATFKILESSTGAGIFEFNRCWILFFVSYLSELHRIVEAGYGWNLLFVMQKG